MSYWFAYRVAADRNGNRPGAAILEGPFESYHHAKSVKVGIRGYDMEKTAIFPADKKEEAEKHLKLETWMV